MKWATGIIVIFTILYGVNQAWHMRGSTWGTGLMVSPLSSLLVGLFLAWLFRSIWRLYRGKIDDTGVGATLSWICKGVAVFYLLLTGFVVSRDHYFDLIPYLVGMAGLSWGLGWMIRRGFAAKNSN